MKSRVLEIEADSEGTFIERLNRFVARIEINGNEELVHVHDPGRLKELLFPGNRVLLKKATNPGRKTGWDVIASWSPAGWVFTNSGYHRKISEAVFRMPEISPIQNIVKVEPEVKLGRSRIDFRVHTSDSGPVWVEIKGCTLARNGVALFPDAPTTRGQRHLEELIEVAKTGERAAVIFLVFRPDATCFLPNGETDPAFEKLFYNAVRAGVEIHPLLFSYDGKNIYFLEEIPICGR